MEDAYGRVTACVYKHIVRIGVCDGLSRGGARKIFEGIGDALFGHLW